MKSLNLILYKKVAIVKKTHLKDRRFNILPVLITGAFLPFSAFLKLNEVLNLTTFKLLNIIKAFHSIFVIC